MTTVYRPLAAGTLACLALAPVVAQRGPSPAPTGLPPQVLALACAPVAAIEAPDHPLRVTGGQDTLGRPVFAPGDLVTINAGTDNGIDVGQEFFVRRLQTPQGARVSREAPGVIRTAGWIRIYAVDDEMSLATITHACDALEVGDYLEPVVLPEPVVPDVTRARAERDNYGRVLPGNDGLQAFAGGDFFVLDRGSDDGVAVGAQFVLYRDKRLPGNFLYELGEAVAVVVQPETATLQVTLARDALLVGDYVAMRREEAE